jgi:Ca2+-binding EF-hand superfamily protein
MKAFGMEVKKQDIRDIYAEIGKEIKEGLTFNDFIGIMSTRMVCILLFRDLEIQRRKFLKFSNYLTRIT